MYICAEKLAGDVAFSFLKTLGKRGGGVVLKERMNGMISFRDLKFIASSYVP